MFITKYVERMKIMINKLEEAKAILKKFNQEHLLNGYEKLDDKKKQELLEQILNIDFELIKSFLENLCIETDSNKSVYIRELILQYAR